MQHLINPYLLKFPFPWSVRRIVFWYRIIFHFYIHYAWCHSKIFLLCTLNIFHVMIFPVGPQMGPTRTNFSHGLTTEQTKLISSLAIRIISMYFAYLIFLNVLFPVWLRNLSISAGLKPFLSRILSYYIQFSIEKKL